MSPDWKMNIAYNAALQAATIALYACGFRASREAHHLRVIQSLEFTIKADKEIIDQLDIDSVEYRRAPQELRLNDIGRVRVRLADDLPIDDYDG